MPLPPQISNRAAHLLELAWPVIQHGIHPATWLTWVQSLPDELLRTRPVLNAGYGWTLADGGDLEAAQMRLNDAAQWLDAADTRAMVVVNEREFRALPATIAIARAYLAQAHGDAPTTIEHTQRALDLLAPEDHNWRGTAAMFLGLANWANGNLSAAYRALADSVAHLHDAGNNHLQIVGTVMLADIRAGAGSPSRGKAHL